MITITLTTGDVNNYNLTTSPDELSISENTSFKYHGQYEMIKDKLEETETIILRINDQPNN